MTQTSTGRLIRGLDAEQRREQRRSAVLETALRLFAEQGYLNTPIEQLCQEAFVSTRSFYDLFKSRDEVHRALYTELAAAMEREMAERLSVLPEDEEEATRILVTGFVESAFGDPQRARVLWGGWRALTPEAELQRRETREWSAAFLDGIWKHYGVKGDNHAIAVALIGGIFDLITVWMIDGDPSDEAAVAPVADQLERFYRAVRRGLD